MDIGKSLPVTRSAPPPYAATGDEAHWEGLELVAVMLSARSERSRS